MAYEKILVSAFIGYRKLKTAEGDTRIVAFCGPTYMAPQTSQKFLRFWMILPQLSSKILKSYRWLFSIIKFFLILACYGNAVHYLKMLKL